MARLIRNEGGAVGLIALFDTYNLSMVKQATTRIGRFSALRQKFGFHLENLTQLGVKDLFGYLSEKLRMAEEAGQGKVAAGLENLKNAVSGAAEDAGAEVYIQEINHQAGWSFVPQASEARITVFSPRKNYDFFPDPKMGWSEITGGHLEVVELPVLPHAMLIEPYATTLASQLKSRLSSTSADKVRA
jgi:thioesterase domain-containing protein